MSLSQDCNSSCVCFQCVRRPDLGDEPVSRHSAVLRPPSLRVPPEQQATAGGGLGHGQQQPAVRDGGEAAARPHREHSGQALRQEEVHAARPRRGQSAVHH